MGNRQLSSQEISALIDHVLAQKDPSITGLRTVLKARSEPVKEFPLKPLDLDQFESSKRPLKQEERTILELERTIANLRDALSRQKAEAEEAIENAYRKGLEEGKSSGFEEGRTGATTEYEKRLASLQHSVGNSLQQVEQWKQNLFRDSLHLTVRLAIEMARKVINTELTLNSSIVAATIKRALSYIADRENNIAIEKQVTLGLKNTDCIEVKNLKEGIEIITVGLYGIKDKARIKIVNLGE